jgi:hypothetical protein
MSGQIFISYRREESRWSARSLHDRLSRHFDAKQIFMDIDSVGLGEDFVKAIETTVEKCDVLIAVIGNNWLTSKDENGGRRLENPEDFVRMEIRAALKRNICVIPVLVDGASMPRPSDLPEDSQPLVRRNALRVSDTSFDGDCQRLVTAITQVFAGAANLGIDRLETERRQYGGGGNDKAAPAKPRPIAVTKEKRSPNLTTLAIVLVLILGVMLVTGVGSKLFVGEKPKPNEPLVASTPGYTPSQRQPAADYTQLSSKPTQGVTENNANITGQWKDEAGTLYVITQNGSEFSFKASNPTYGRFWGTGKIAGDQLTSNFQVATPSGATARGTGTGILSGDVIHTTSSDPIYGAVAHTLARTSE